MKNKKTVIKVVAVIAVAAVFYLSLFTTGEKAFDMDTMAEGGEITVLRIDSSYPEYNSKEPYGLRETYLLDDAQKAELLDFIAQSKYRKRISINVFTFIPGISMDSVSSSDKVDYRIYINNDGNENEAGFITCGCDYIRPIEDGYRYVKILDKNWGEKLDEIIADAQIIDTNREE
ncbi:MAG: hypothetical protein IJO54_03980 [Oscillospiraceae bacterium]|nr:hypothetical protein [Oscillospiraceae bacterium]